ncbi:MAG: hypothetical protein ACJASO_000712 [Cyclobacteriaceae bacterium]|jgi:hypothetical protein
MIEPVILRLIQKRYHAGNQKHRDHSPRRSR